MTTCISSGAHACSTVLGDVDLLRVITSFQRGMPGYLLAMSNRLGMGTGIGTTSSSAVSPERTTGQAISLMEHAIRTNDQRALHMILALHDTHQQHVTVPSSSSSPLSVDALQTLDPRFRFREPFRVAARHGRTEILQWLVMHCPPPPQQQQQQQQSSSYDGWLADPWLLDAAIQSLQEETIHWVLAHHHRHVHTVDQDSTSLTLNHTTNDTNEFTNDTNEFTNDTNEFTNDAVGMAYSCPVRTSTLDRVAASGEMRILQFVLAGMTERGRRWALTTNAMDGAASAGHLEMVMYLHALLQEPHGCSSTALDLAAQHGHLAVVMFLHHHVHASCTTAAVDGAAEQGHLDVVQFLLAHRQEGGTFRAMERAAWNGHVHVVSWLWRQAPGCLEEATRWTVIKAAASQGHLEVVRLLMECRASTMVARCPSIIVDAAATRGQLHVVQYLQQYREDDGTSGGCCCASSKAMDGAAANGHLDVVKFLHHHQHPHDHYHLRQDAACTVRAMDDAARNGHLGTVQFLHEQRLEGCSTRAMDEAAGHGHLSIVQFLHMHRSEGCTAQALVSAAASGYLSVVTFLLTHRRATIPVSVSVLALAMEQAATNGHLDVLRHLYQDEALLASSPGEEDSSSPASSSLWMAHVEKALAGAASHGHLHVIRFLLESAASTITHLRPALCNASESGHWRVVRYLLRHCEAQQQQQLSTLRGFTLSAAISKAVLHGHDEILVMLLYARLPVKLIHLYTLRGALQDGNRVILALLTSPMARALTSAEFCEWRDIQQVVSEQERVVMQIVAAAARGDLEVLQNLVHLHHQWVVPIPASALTMAVKHGHVDIVRFLLTHSSRQTSNVSDNDLETIIQWAKAAGQTVLAAFLRRQQASQAAASLSSSRITAIRPQPPPVSRVRIVDSHSSSLLTVG